MLSGQETSVPRVLQIGQRPQQSRVQDLSHFTRLVEVNTSMPSKGRLEFSKDVHLPSQIQPRQAQVPEDCHSSVSS